MLLTRLARAVSYNSHWALIPIALLLLFPSPWMALGFIGVLVVLGCRWLARGSPIPATPLNVPLLILLFMVGVGFAVSSEPALALLTASQVVASATIFFVLTDCIDSQAGLWRVAKVLVVLGVLFALIAPLTVDLSRVKFLEFSRGYLQLWPRLPKLTNPNILAGALAPIVPIAFSLIAQSERSARMLGALALAPLIGTMILLQSRGAIFALALGLLVGLALYRSWLLPVIPLALAALVAFRSVSGGPPLTQFLFGTIGSSTVNTLMQRQELWVQSLYLIRQSPWLGIGLGAYPVVASISWPHSLASPGPVYNHAHNLFFQVALDAGVLGFAAFVAVLILAVRIAWHAYRGNRELTLSIGILASFVIVVFHGMGDVAVWGTAKSSIVLWILLSLAAGLVQIRGLGTSEV